MNWRSIAFWSFLALLLAVLSGYGLDLYFGYSRYQVIPSSRVAAYRLDRKSGEMLFVAGDKARPVVIERAEKQLSTSKLQSYEGSSVSSVDVFYSCMSDLRNATTAQEAHYVDHQKYAENINALSGDTYGLYLSTGVKIEILHAGRENYKMIAYPDIPDPKYWFEIEGPGGTVVRRDAIK